MNVLGYPVNGLVVDDAYIPETSTSYLSTVTENPTLNSTSTRISSYITYNSPGDTSTMRPTTTSMPSNPSNAASCARISPNIVAAITSSIVVLTTILSLVVYILWRRRYAKKFHPCELPNSGIPKAGELDGQSISEMEGPSRTQSDERVVVLEFEPVEMSG